MEQSGSRRWVLSVAAALLVAAVLVTGWWLARPGPVEADYQVAAGGGASQQPADPGGGSDGRPGRSGGTGGDRPATGPDPVMVVQDGVRIDGYAVRGHRLVLQYTTGVPECYGSVTAQQVLEGADTVTVTLVRVLPEEPADACIDLAVVGTVTVELAAPLGRRAVHDGAFEPPVPVRGTPGGPGVPGGAR